MKTFLRSVVALMMILAMLMPASALAASPQELYDEVWKLINSRFVDEDKNGQDWRIWRNRYDKVLEDETDSYVAIESMLASLDDRYTRFLDPEEFAEEGRSIKAQLFGIGIQIGSRGDKLLVISPIDETPASEAGLQANDEITEIDGKSTKGMTVKDAADLIRGEKGTKVKLMIRRKDKADKLYEIMRDEIKLKAVSLKNPFDVAIPADLGYVKLSTFLSNKAAIEIKAALKELGTKKGYILDLRSNPGGLLSNAITIADDFLDDGSIVSTVDRDGYKEIRWDNKPVITNKPIVVLIDGGSASASEILSGALKDHNRAVLVGQRTFGKGLVQEINRLPGRSGVNITTQRYLTPNDTDINKLGIEPHFTVEITEEDIKEKRDPQLQKGIAVLQEMVAGKSLKMMLTAAASEKSEKESATETAEALAKKKIRK